MKSSVVLAAAVLATAGFSVQAMPGMPSSNGATIKGEVLLVESVSGYTYLKLKTKDGEIWASVPSAAVKKGQQVTLEDPMTMQNFESKALKRKFDKIVFASLSDPSAAKPAPLAGHGAASTPAAPVARMAKATAKDAKTVAEVVDGKAALKDKTVTIRGQVVKVSNGVLGKNWLHLQDGSGSAAKGTHDIVVTTNDAVTVGDIVSASGTVRTDVNIGSGYTYAVLVEGARVRK